MLDDSDYGRCGRDGMHRDHAPDEIERYRTGIEFLKRRRAAEFQVEEISNDEPAREIHGTSPEGHHP